MFERVQVDGYDALKRVLAETSVRAIVLFTGSKDSETGKSWCPDCETADPIIERCVEEVSGSDFANDHETCFIVCNVGQRAYWKDRSNPFRTDAELKITCVPTLMDTTVKGKRLMEEQLTNGTLVKAFFLEDAE